MSTRAKGKATKGKAASTQIERACYRTALSNAVPLASLGLSASVVATASENSKETRGLGGEQQARETTHIVEKNINLEEVGISCVSAMRHMLGEGFQGAGRNE